MIRNGESKPRGHTNFAAQISSLASVLVSVKSVHFFAPRTSSNILYVAMFQKTNCKLHAKTILTGSLYLETAIFRNSHNIILKNILYLETAIIFRNSHNDQSKDLSMTYLFRISLLHRTSAVLPWSSDAEGNAPFAISRLTSPRSPSFAACKRIIGHRQQCVQ